MTIDVEDYFQVSAFEKHIPFSDWDRRELRVARNVDLILDLLDEHGAKGTFFVLAWLAERMPAMIRKIVDAGHEIASHGSTHTRVTDQTPDAFRQDVLNAKRIIEDLSGQEVIGYRAASYSIGDANLWALDVLGETGHRYSSSIYPIRHDHYGMPDAPRFAFRVEQANLTEVPITTISLFGRNWPCGGGGYFRLLPYRLSRWGLNRVNRLEREAAIFYFHPWELDPEQPRVAGIDMRTRFRHYLNLNRFEARLRRLLGDFRWDRLDRAFAFR